MTLGIIFDVSQLGLMRSNMWSCAGICRVTKRWMKELAHHHELSMDYYYGHELGVIEGSISIINDEQLTAAPELATNVAYRIRRQWPGESRPPIRGFREPLRQREVRGVMNEAMSRVLALSDGVLVSSTRRRQERYLAKGDVFHDNSFPFPNPALNDDVVAGNRRIAKVITIYDLIAARHPEYYPQDAAEQFAHQLSLLDSSHWIICASEHTRDQLCEDTSVDRDRIAVVNWAADATLFYQCSDPVKMRVVREKYALPSMSYLLSVCTLEPRKNVPLLLESFVRMVRDEKIDDLALVLTGGGGWVPEVMESIDKIISRNRWLAGKICVTGFVADEDLAPLYSGAIGFVYPSIIEGFGLPPLEALQCGVPVITSNTSSLP